MKIISCILWVFLLASCSGQSETAKTQSNVKKPSCLDLKLGNGFKTNAEMDLAFECVRASTRFPDLMTYLDRTKKEVGNDTIRQLTNQLLNLKNLDALTNILSRWEARVGAADRSEFDASLRPLFDRPTWANVLDAVRILNDKPIGGVVVLQTLDFAGKILEDPVKAEAIRAATEHFLDLPETNELFVTVRDTFGDRDMGNLWQSALAQTQKIAAAGELGGIVLAQVELSKTKSFLELQKSMSGERLETIWKFIHQIPPSFPKVLRSISKLNGTLKCGPNAEIPFPLNAAVDFSQRVVRGTIPANGLIHVIAQRWPQELCGLEREDVNSLVALETGIFSPSGKPMRDVLELFVRNQEEEKLMNWIKALSESGLGGVWEDWLTKGFEKGFLQRLLDLWNKTNEVQIHWARGQKEPFLGFALNQMNLRLLSPMLAFTFLQKDLPEVAKAFIQLLQVDDLPERVRGFFAPQSFASLRALCLALWDEKTIPESFVESLRIVIKSEVSDFFGKNPPSSPVAIQALQFLNAIKAAYATK